VQEQQQYSSNKSICADVALWSHRCC
jgi:hypothetical protein